MIIFVDIETISDGEYKEKHIEKYWDKITFLPELNKILTICVWVETKEWIVVKNLEWNEKEQIEKFFESIKWNKISWFNIKKFDLPFIIKRALVYQIEIPYELKFWWKKPWELENIIDLQEVYSNLVFWSIWNLDLICNFLWITSPKSWNIDWSLVQEFYNNWKETEIIEYCKRDVLATIELYNYFKKYNLI